MFMHPAVALLITEPNLFVLVDAAVHFHDEPKLRAVEVRDETPEWMLSSKLQPHKAPIAQ